MEKKNNELEAALEKISKLAKEPLRDTEISVARLLFSPDEPASIAETAEMLSLTRQRVCQVVNTLYQKAAEANQPLC